MNTETNSNGQDKVHDLLIERANADYNKRLQDKQKRFGKAHDVDEELQSRARIQKANRDELIRLMQVYEFTIQAKDFANWRPTRRIKTSIPGVWEYVELIATNGILGIFLDEHNEPIYGHIQFVEGVKTLYPLEDSKVTKTKEKKPKKLTKRQQFLQTL